MKITFAGAAKTVTGSRHIVQLWDNTKILLDCGMYQGMGKDTHALNSEDFADPLSVSAILLSHAHIDHSGLIPKFVKDGFTGPIFCTEATHALCEIMLRDSAYIQEADVNYSNKRHQREGDAAYEPLYGFLDVEQALNQFVIVKENEKTAITNGIKATFIPNGHILGSAAIYLDIDEISEKHTLLYTADIGRYDATLMRNPERPPQADYVICESTYGDRLHDHTIDAEQELLNAVLHTLGEKKGKLIIPAFSLGRTQELVFALNKLDLHGLLPDVKIFVDSPLAIDATDIMRRYSHLLNREVSRFKKGTRHDPFGFKKLIYVKEQKYSRRINDLDEPCIIISASGMADAGRVKHHIYHGIEKAKNTILFVGYAEPSSLAGRLQRGDKIVTIYGDERKVNAEIKYIKSLSAHADYSEMLRYLEGNNSGKVKRLFLVHGEEEVAEHFKKHLKENGYHNVHIPDKNMTFTS
ncbi:MBL fold metallo-hydrolase RNA specificity domain-containing protein [Brumimicrobium oceani]|uniref:MBL fold metallo-hydrolase n=1 Tax=Brumimicrobium oceani TaxID=2100725 RepID=A0A2U2XAQ5_9FLAO|nr:MBL fold metallo-hydrolase [Brumimicrobium oceani]PWH84876.1 MBL fold metallo-hydrolase [Brumimicrobium oceani]